MTCQEMRDFAISQVEWGTNQNEWLTRQIERINNRLKQTRKEDKEQKEFARTYEGGKYAHLYEGNYQGDETRKLINERRRHQRELKKNAATIEHYKREIEKYTDPADKPQEAPQEAPAAEAEQQPTETADAAQAAPAARQADDTAAAILGAIGAPAPAHTITVTWANGTRATYSAAMLDLLRTDPAALDIQDDDTGELVYIKPDPAPTAEEPEETETTEDAPADPDAATLAAIAAIIEEAERMRSAYFFQPPTSASSRRAYERRHSHEEITWTESGHTYTAAYTVSCTCGNIYARGEYTRDGKRTTLTAIRNSYKRLGA